MIMIPDMFTNEVAGFMETFIYVFIVVAAIMVLYKDYKANKAIHNLCVSQDECCDMINKMIQYAQTSDDTAMNRLNVNRVKHIAHLAAICEAGFEINRIFKRSANTHNTFSKEWANTGLTISKLYSKSFNKAILILEEIKSGEYKFCGDFNYEAMVNEASEIEDDDEWNDWIDMNIGYLKKYIGLKVHAIMNVEVANILQIPIEINDSKEI